MHRPSDTFDNIYGTGTDPWHVVWFSLILFRIDYCNAVLHGAPSYSIEKLQRVRNNSVRIVLEASRRSHACSPLLGMLHWLPVQQRIDYKVALLTFKVRSTSTPSYLRRLMQDCEHRTRPQPLRSTTTTLYILRRRHLRNVHPSLLTINMVGGGYHFYLKFWAKLAPLLQKHRFLIDFRS